MANQGQQLARYEFRRRLEELSSVRGRATELISVYVPPSRQISDVAAYLRNEYAQSSNIKSRTTRKNVCWAIESIIGKLKYFKEPPPNGVVIFVGTRALSGDQSEPVSVVLEPPEPIGAFLYRCDSSFFLDPLVDMAAEKDVYGLLVIDRSEGTVGLLRGKRIIPVKNKHSQVPSKHGRGGQSARRFERLIEIAAHEWFVKMGELANEAFGNEKGLKAILVGGPGATKEYFIKEGYMHHELRKKILPTLFDTGYTDEHGLKELVEKAQEALSDLDLMKEKRLVQRLMTEIRRPDGGLAAYGEAQVRDALARGAVDILLVSDGIRMVRVVSVCQACGIEVASTVKQGAGLGRCPKCQGPLQERERVDIIQDLFRLAAGANTSVEMVSADSEEGQMLLSAFGGMAAVLRYRV